MQLLPWRERHSLQVFLKRRIHGFQYWADVGACQEVMHFVANNGCGVAEGADTVSIISVAEGADTE